MKKIIFTCVMIVLALTMVQCKKHKKTAATDGALSSDQKEASVIKNDQIKIDPVYTWPGSTDPFDVAGIKVEGDSLKVEVRYGGGCKDHEFGMHTNMMWMKSLPPILNLYLEHENNDDNCRALLTRTLTFDLSTVRHSDINQVKLIVNGDRERMVTYVY